MSKKSLKILVDEMKDGMDEKLIQRGFDAFSVKKLRAEGKIKGPDFNVLKYAEENKLILLTLDNENIDACRENNFPHIPIDEDGIFEMVLDKLSKF